MFTFLSVQTELVLFLVGTGAMLGYALLVGNGCKEPAKAWRWAPESPGSWRAGSQWTLTVADRHSWASSVLCANRQKPGTPGRQTDSRPARTRIPHSSGIRSERS
jgi:hypothetical protein